MGERPDGLDHLAGSDFATLQRLADQAGTTPCRMACALIEATLGSVRTFGVTPGGTGLRDVANRARRKQGE